jgi:hypothetical protein
MSSNVCLNGVFCNAATFFWLPNLESMELTLPRFGSTRISRIAIPRAAKLRSLVVHQAVVRPLDLEKIGVSPNLTTLICELSYLPFQEQSTLDFDPAVIHCHKIWKALLRLKASLEHWRSSSRSSMDMLMISPIMPNVVGWQFYPDSAHCAGSKSRRSLTSLSL